MKNKTFLIKTQNSKDSKEQIVTFQGDLGIKNASAIKESLLGLKLTAEVITLQFKNVDKLDITTIQNMAALRNILLKDGKKVEAKQELPQDIERLLINTGFKTTL